MIWPRLLDEEPNPTTFNRQPATRVVSWLEWLARALGRHGRHWYFVHELYVYAPDRENDFKRFRNRAGFTGVTLVAAVMCAVGVIVRDVHSSLVAGGVLYAIWLFGYVYFRRSGSPVVNKTIGLNKGEAPSRHTRVSLRERCERYVKHPKWHLGRPGCFPRDHEAFLEWCGGSERTWIRKVGSGYQFRHDDFRQFLADGVSGQSPATTGDAVVDR